MKPTTKSQNSGSYYMLMRCLLCCGLLNAPLLQWLDFDPACLSPDLFALLVSHLLCNVYAALLRGGACLRALLHTPALNQPCVRGWWSSSWPTT